ncbi:MAG TPA: hypothetical protein VHZ24_03585 [Pirellulales bacterium]|jgi:hypothetical protein|nr:hypothetical protein [Pirellulales bacterium]
MNVWTLLFAAVAAGTLECGRRRLRGTTLTAAWWWGVAAMTAALAAACATTSEAERNLPSPIAHLALVLSLAPGVAVLGAKRPQHHAWQWIVLTLVVVLGLPAFEATMLRAGAPIVLHPARAGFILVLMLVTLGNYLPTRQAPAAMSFAAGQVLLLARYLPSLASRYGTESATAPLALWTFALVAAALVAWLPRRVSRWDRLWLDFRDAYGVVWALRVADRFNAANRANGRSAQITWRRAHGGPAGEPDPASQHVLRMLLLRFVSPAWLDERGSG